MITIKRLVEIVDGKLMKSEKKPSEKIKGFEFDSRKISEGKVFIPIKGRRDGHLFIKDAEKKGAIATLTSKNIETSIPKIIVKDTLQSLTKLARYKRERYSGKVIGITGSVGKTTTKELLKHTLGKFFFCEASIESYNNLLGVSYTLANLKNSDFHIQEMGTSAPGEIETLTNLTKPDIAILTTIAPAHLEGFETVESLEEEKLSIFSNGAFAIAPVKYRKRIKNGLFFGKGGDGEILDIKQGKNKTLFTVKIFGETVKGTITVPGKGVLNSVIITLLAGKLLDINLKELIEAIETFKPPKWRMEIERIGNITLIKDFYNANPESMKNAIEVLSQYTTPKVAILGEMLELGELSENLHKEIGEFLNTYNVEEAIFFGKNSLFYLNSFKGKGYHFVSRKEFLSFIETFEFSGKAILIKGSRGNKLEEVAEIIKKRYI